MMSLKETHKRKLISQQHVNDEQLKISHIFAYWLRRQAKEFVVQLEKLMRYFFAIVRLRLPQQHSTSLFCCDSIYTLHIFFFNMKVELTRLHVFTSRLFFKLSHGWLLSLPLSSYISPSTLWWIYFLHEWMSKWLKIIKEKREKKEISRHSIHVVCYVM